MEGVTPGDALHEVLPPARSVPDLGSRLAEVGRRQVEQQGAARAAVSCMARTSDRQHERDLPEQDRMCIWRRASGSSRHGQAAVQGGAGDLPVLDQESGPGPA